MSTTVNFNNANYIVPAVGDRRWGTNVSNLLIALGRNALSKAGGSFVLTADANFGTNFGLVAKYVKSASSNIAQSGVIRLANDEGISFRNAANDADLLLKVNSSNVIEFAGTALSTAASAVTLTGAQTVSDKTLTNVAGITLAASAPINWAAGNVSLGASLGLNTLTVGGVSTTTYMPGILKGKIVASESDSLFMNTDAVGSGADWTATIVRPTSGMLANATYTLPLTTDTLVGRATTDTLLNKTLTSPVINTPTGIVKGDVGLGDVDNTSDANKPVSTATQTALNLKANLASPTFTGTVTLPSGQALTGPSIATPTITTAETFANVSTPSTPSAGFGKLYFKSDVPTYLDSAGNERVIANTAASFANPMSAVGDVVYGGTAGAATRLAPNTTTAKQFLSQTGTGSAGQAPVWSALPAASSSAAGTVTYEDSGSFTVYLKSGAAVGTTTSTGVSGTAYYSRSGKNVMVTLPGISVTSPDAVFSISTSNSANTNTWPAGLTPVSSSVQSDVVVVRAGVGSKALYALSTAGVLQIFGDLSGGSFGATNQEKGVLKTSLSYTVA